jgi:hypothetical protein
MKWLRIISIDGPQSVVSKDGSWANRLWGLDVVGTGLRLCLIFGFGIGVVDLSGSTTEI